MKDIITWKDLKNAVELLGATDDTIICINDGYSIEDVCIDTIEFDNHDNIDYIQLKYTL